MESLKYLCELGIIFIIGFLQMRTFKHRRMMLLGQILVATA